MKLILLAPWPWTCSLSKIYIFLHLSAFYHLGQQIASGTILRLTTCCYPLYMFFVLLLLFDAFAFKVMYLSSFGDPKVLYPQKGFFSSPLSPGRSLYWDIYPIGLHFLSLFTGMFFGLAWEDICGGTFFLSFPLLSRSRRWLIKPTFPAKMPLRTCVWTSEKGRVRDGEDLLLAFTLVAIC